ncbi:hypothetical protein LSH36_25g10083 [Paralvinella palmiformis]|uniref:Uncharacterized protein n=1 Tax=Paralvinella palmiformis TaxID=53620 RepID=A0AAD9NGS8_9ANNE|nr:hypothetical protein LSH36_25g10083 [Paralvinella palmiformis]
MIDVHGCSNIYFQNDSGFLSKNNNSLERASLPLRNNACSPNSGAEFEGNISDLYQGLPNKGARILSSIPGKQCTRIFGVQCHGQHETTPVDDVIYQSVTSAKGLRAVNCTNYLSVSHLPKSHTSLCHLYNYYTQASRLSQPHVLPSHTSRPYTSLSHISTLYHLPLSSLSTSSLSTSTMSTSYLSTSCTSCTGTFYQLHGRCVLRGTYPLPGHPTRNDYSAIWPTFNKVTIDNLSSLPNEAVSWRDSVLTWLDKSIGSNSLCEW